MNRLALILALALVPPAMAKAPASSDPDLAPWFSTLHNPATGAFCCDQADGHILSATEWRTVGGAYQVLIDTVWRDVPTVAVLDRIDNPTGSAVAFWLGHGATILCFVRPSET